MPVPSPAAQPRFRRKWLFGCLGAILLLVPLAGVFFVGVFNFAFGKREHGRVPPGDASHFDPVASLGAVRAYAGTDSRLVSINARFVRADGTMDLPADYQPSPTVEYRFLREIAAPATALPVGAGGNADGRWHEPVRVVVSRPGRFRSVRRIGGPVGGADLQYYSRGMERESDPPSGRALAADVPSPRCSFKRLWDQALANGAAASSVAVIEYDRDGYDFRIRDTRFVMTFDPDCAVRSTRK